MAFQRHPCKLPALKKVDSYLEKSGGLVSISMKAWTLKRVPACLP